MKTTLLFNSLLAILVFATACNKDKLQHTSAEGKVVDTTTQQPITNALVKLVTQKKQFLGYGGYSVVDSMRSDTEGKFSFSFEADDDFVYDLQAKATHHIDQGTLIGIINGEKNNKDFPLQPEAFLKIKFINVPPLDTIQNISMVVNTLTPPPPTPFTISGPKSFSGQVWGNKDIGIIYWMTKRGVESKFNANVYCLSHDTTTFTIEY
jgi:hypothetical protein